MSFFILLAAVPNLHAYTLPPELLVKAKALESTRTALYFGGTAWTIGVLALLVRGRMGERIARLAERGVGASRPWLQGFIAAPLWLLLLALAGLPVSVVSHHVSLVYGLSIEGWGAWSADWAKSTLLMLLVGTLVVSCLYAMLRRSTRWGWLGFWLLTLPLVVLGVFVAPLVIDPLFNHFTPLTKRDPALVVQLERVVARGGLSIPPSRMFVMDASRRYTGMNAYVTGFGASKRIVVWDTTLPDAGAGMTADELLDIYGHEQGHYVLGHIWKGMLYSAVLLFFFYWLAFRIIQAVIDRRGEAWHMAANPSDWSSLGLFLLVATTLGFLADPLANAFSRMEEHQADVYGQEVIHGLVADPQVVAVRDFNRLGRMWLEDPEPNRFVVWWSYTHPPTGERANFAAAYDPWKPGGVPSPGTFHVELSVDAQGLPFVRRPPASIIAMTTMENDTTPTPGTAPGDSNKQTLTIEEIMALLPHRYPFLLIDRVVQVERKKRIVAIKNVTINEPFFQGHFPDYPIMPGVLVVEAMAQAGGLLILLDIEDPASKLLLFTGVDGAKFRRPIKPGDQLRIEVNVLQLRARAVRLEGKAYVDGKLACEATLSCGLVPREKKKPEASVGEAPLPTELHAVTTE